MCGIAALLRLDGGMVNREVLERVTRTMAHRGPDSEGYHLEEALGLGHRRLAIVDLATGHQPMSDETGTLWLVCNGEIYNHADLRRALEARGHTFATRSDNEVILHLYQEHGPALVEQLRGMFAFALWDGAHRRLVLARDRFGIKPLYYYQDAFLLAAASEAKALLAIPGLRPALREECLAELLLNGFISGEQSVFRGLRRLPPAHVLVSENGVSRLERYWEPPALAPDPPEAAQQLGALLGEAVSSHLMSDVPLGLFLSGGLDSTAIAHLMAPQVKKPLLAFTARVRGGFDEGPPSQQAASKVGAAWEAAEVDARTFADLLPGLVWHHDEPMGFPAAVPLYAVSRLAAGKVKVVLTGEGADELLAGYSRYAITLANARWGRHWQALPYPLRRGLGAIASRMPGVRAKAGRTFLARALTPRDLYFSNFTGGVSPRGLEAMLGSGLYRKQDDPFAVGETAWGKASGWLEGMIRADLATYLVELLAKQDRMSMAASLESRVPYLDGPFAEFCLRLPESRKVQGRTGKVILREWAAWSLPPETVQGAKHGFPVPWSAWLRRDLREWVSELLLGGLVRRELVNGASIRSALKAHLAGRERGELLWRLVNLELWLRAFIDRAKPWEQYEP